MKHCATNRMLAAQQPQLPQAEGRMQHLGVLQVDAGELPGLRALVVALEGAEGDGELEPAVIGEAFRDVLAGACVCVAVLLGFEVVQEDFKLCRKTLRSTGCKGKRAGRQAGSQTSSDYRSRACASSLVVNQRQQQFVSGVMQPVGQFLLLVSPQRARVRVTIDIQRCWQLSPPLPPILLLLLLLLLQ
jgi:hypothetical protein